MIGRVRCCDCASFPGRHMICSKIGATIGRVAAWRTCSGFALPTPTPPKPLPAAILAPDVRAQGDAAPDPGAGRLAALVTALGPLSAHVQHLGRSGTGFAVRLHRDTPTDAAAAIYAECGRFAGQLRAQSAKPAPKVRKPRAGRASR
jgi:hypothetical protein